MDEGGNGKGFNEQIYLGAKTIINKTKGGNKRDIKTCTFSELLFSLIYILKEF